MIERCWICGGEAYALVDDDGFYHIGCDKYWQCPNNILNTDNSFNTKREAVVWWNRCAREVYKQCPRRDKS